MEEQKQVIKNAKMFPGGKIGTIFGRESILHE